MNKPNAPVLAIDPGEARLGVAVSDPTATIASPLAVIKHTARAQDAATIVQYAEQRGAALIVVGAALDDEGRPTPQMRHAEKLVDAIRALTTLPVVLWDEYGSTQRAQAARRAMGVSRRKRRGHLDDIAATVILQSWLDAHSDLPPAQDYADAP